MLVQQNYGNLNTTPRLDGSVNMTCVVECAYFLKYCLGCTLKPVSSSFHPADKKYIKFIDFLHLLFIIFRVTFFFYFLLFLIGGNPLSHVFRKSNYVK